MNMDYGHQKALVADMKLGQSWAGAFLLAEELESEDFERDALSELPWDGIQILKKDE